MASAKGPSIINASFANQTFPSRWKHAEIIPILKSSYREHDLADNNRPISLLPILSKVCEKVALNQLMPYLSSHNRLATIKVAINNDTLPKRH